jgi:hypothetical protein
MTCVVWRARVHYVRTRAPPFAYLCIIKAVLNLLSEHQNSRFSAKNALCHSIFFCCAAQPWWAAQLLWASGPHHLPDLLLQVVSGSVPLTGTLTDRSARRGRWEHGRRPDPRDSPTPVACAWAVGQARPDAV